MKNLLSSKLQKHDSAIASQKFDRKKVFALTLSTLLILVVVSESIRLALLSW